MLNGGSIHHLVYIAAPYVFYVLGTLTTVYASRIRTDDDDRERYMRYVIDQDMEDVMRRDRAAWREPLTSMGKVSIVPDLLEQRAANQGVLPQGTDITDIHLKVKVPMDDFRELMRGGCPRYPGDPRENEDEEDLSWIQEHNLYS